MMKAIDLMANLERQFNENINSHVFLIETKSQEEILKIIKDIIKKVISADSIMSIQIDDETYLEMIIIRPDGKEIKKDEIKELQNRLKTKPLLSDKMFYIILSAENLNPIASNKLLKTIEEPADNIIGFLITSNSDIILPTIKSRCETILISEQENIITEIVEETQNTVKRLIESIEKKDHLEFTKAKLEEKTIKEDFKNVEKLLKSYYNTACNLSAEENIDQNIINFIRQHNDYQRMVRKARYLNEIFNKLTANMNNDLLLEKIFIELKEVN